MMRPSTETSTTTATPIRLPSMPRPAPGPRYPHATSGANITPAATASIGKIPRRFLFIERVSPVLASGLPAPNPLLRAEAHFQTATPIPCDESSISYFGPPQPRGAARDAVLGIHAR